MYEVLKVTGLDIQRGDPAGVEPDTVPVRMTITLEGKIPCDCDPVTVEVQWLQSEINRAVLNAINDRLSGGEFAARIKEICAEAQLTERIERIESALRWVGRRLHDDSVANLSTRDGETEFKEISGETQ